MRRQHQVAEATPQHVVVLSERRSADTVRTLKALLKAAEEGRIRGFVYGVRFTSGSPDWDVGVTGECEKDGINALGLTSKLWGRINAKHDSASK